MPRKPKPRPNRERQMDEIAKEVKKHEARQKLGEKLKKQKMRYRKQREDYNKGKRV